MLDSWPLTGRIEEMRLAAQFLASDQGGGLVIGGAAGVGKSRLFRDALTAAGSRGATVRWVTATSSARALPLGAFASWVTTPSGDQLQLVRSVIEALTVGERVILGIDDAQLLDDLSVFVLHQVAQRGDVKLVMTVRAQEPIPLALQELWTSRQFQRVELQPLSRDEAGALAGAALGGRIDPAAVMRLWRLTRGNALYLRHVVEHEVDAGRFIQVGGTWTWRGDVELPPSLISLIEARFGVLPAQTADVLDVLAVAEPMTLAVLRQIVDDDAVEDADARGLITLESGDGELHARLGHPLYGEVRRRTVSTMRLRRLRGRVAAQLSDPRHGGDETVADLVRQASLLLESDLEPDGEMLVRAACGAVWLADLPLADRLAEAAIRAGGGVEAYCVRAHVLSWLSRGDHADEVLTSIPSAGFDPAMHARLAFLRGVNKVFACGDPEAGRMLVENVIQTVPQRAGSPTDAFLAVHDATMGHAATAWERSRTVVFDTLPDIVAAVTAWGLTVAAGESGRLAAALDATKTGYARTTDAYDAAQMRFVIADAHVAALVLAGDVHGAESVASRLREHSADLPGIAQLMSTAIAGRAALAAGRASTARAMLEPIVDAFVGAGDANGWAYRYQIPLTVALAMCGSRLEAVAARDALDGLRHPSYTNYEYEHDIALAWVTAREGVTSDAAHLCLRAAERCRAQGQFAAEVLCLQTAAQFGDREVGDRLAELAAAVQGPRVTAALQLARGLRTSDGNALAAASNAFEEIGDLAAAADAASMCATAHRKYGLRGSAFTAQTRASALREECGGLDTPAAAQCDDHVGLSSREREIVELVGDGLTNRLIAARLHLSVRTVEGHVYRAMARTGARTRDELVAMLRGARRRPRRIE